TLAAVAAATGPLLAGQPSPPPAVVLDNGRIVDRPGPAPPEHGRIVIEGERITQIGPAPQVKAPAGAETIDLGDGTIIPGLIDLHFPIEKQPKMWRRGSS